MIELDTVEFREKLFFVPSVEGEQEFYVFVGRTADRANESAHVDEEMGKYRRRTGRHFESKKLFSWGGWGGGDVHRVEGGRAGGDIGLHCHERDRTN